jgi:phage terminase large subunit
MRAEKTAERRKWEATRVFFANEEARETVVVNVGGARSSKSYSIAQLLVTKFFGETKKHFLTCRKTLPALRQTAYKVAVDLLIEFDLYRFVEHNKSDRTLFSPSNHNFWIFTSIDNPEKIKSTEFNYIHMEEANEFSYDDYRILKLRLSGQTEGREKNQMFLSLNPSDEFGWIKKTLLTEGGFDLIHSTYLDNPFLPADYIENLERLGQQDETYWKIYGLGEWAHVKGLIFGPPRIEVAFPEVDETIYGLDFGYNNPTVLLEIGVREWDAYHREVIYQTRLTNSELIDLMKQRLSTYERRRPIYADSAEPARIAEINAAGFNVYPAKKNVLDGIDFCKRFTHHSLAENVNFNREWPTYKWRIDRNGVTLDEPVKFEDHCPDAARMALYTYLAGAESGAFIGFTKEDVY